MNWRIAPLPAEAAEPLALLHAACFPEEPWEAAALDRILALTGVFGFLGWEADLPIGFVLARDLGEECEILSLGIVPGARRRGIGRALLDAIIDRTRCPPLASIVLEVAVANEAARRLYATAGFVLVGRRPRYYRRGTESFDALILRRAITSGLSPTRK